MEIQAQIVCGRARPPDGFILGPPEEVYGALAGCGVVPLQALIERRRLLESRCVEVEVFGRGEPPDLECESDIEELCPDYDIDPGRVEIFVSPMDFAQHGALCVAQRHILVSPCIDVSDMPALDWEPPADLASWKQ